MFIIRPWISCHPHLTLSLCAVVCGDLKPLGFFCVCVCVLHSSDLGESRAHSEKPLKLSRFFFSFFFLLCQVNVPALYPRLDGFSSSNGSGFGECYHPHAGERAALSSLFLFSVLDAVPPPLRPLGSVLACSVPLVNCVHFHINNTHTHTQTIITRMSTPLHPTRCTHTRTHGMTFYPQTGLMKFHFEQVN